MAIELPDTNFYNQIPTEWNKTKHKLTSTHCIPMSFSFLEKMVIAVSYEPSQRRGSVTGTIFVVCLYGKF